MFKYFLFQMFKYFSFQIFKYCHCQMFKYFTPQGKAVKCNGHQVACSGGWNDPSNCCGFVSAMNMVHVHLHGRTGDHHEACSECLTRCNEGKNTGCPSHANQPCPKQSGNLVNSTLLKDAISHLHQKCSHEVEGAAQLMPSEVRWIGDCCVSCNDPFKFQAFVMLLTGISMFLQKFEFSDLEDDSFIQELFVMHGEFIADGFNLKVLSKGVRDSEQGEPHFHICFPNISMFASQIFQCSISKYFNV